MKTKHPTADGIPVHCAYTTIGKVSSLKPHPRNPNHHGQSQIEIFAKVVKALGWRAPIVVSARSGLIIKGHGKLAVAQFLNLKEVPIDVQAYKTEAEEWQDLLADNRIAELSERNDAEVAALLKQLEEKKVDPAQAGYSAAAVARILDRLSTGEPAPTGEAEIAQADKLQVKWGTKLGQIWALGPHLLFCGDCTKLENWKALMGSKLAQMMHTDPPGNRIKGDKLKADALAKMLHGALTAALKYTHPDAAFYIWHASSGRRDFEFALDRVGLIERQYLTWVKDTFTLCRSDYHWQTEHCFYAERADNRAKWFGDRTQGTVWRIRAVNNDGTATAVANGILLTDGLQAQIFIRSDKPRALKARHLRVLPDQPAFLADRATSTAWEIARDSRKEYLHPNQKPIDLAKVAVLNSSAEGDIVIDQFTGAGATLLACELTGRIFRGMDLDPKWVAVALERWHNMTQEQPELVK